MSINTNEVDILWNDLCNVYGDLANRLKFINLRDKKLLEKRIIKDKINILTCDLKDMIGNIEKICYRLDETYAEKGIIGDNTNLNVFDVDSEIKTIKINRKQKVPATNFRD
jgi:hypothetical protein